MFGIPKSDVAKPGKFKRWLTWFAAAIMVSGMLFLSFTNGFLISPIDPVFHNIVSGVFVAATSWLMWRLYSGHELWYKIAGLFVTPIAAVMAYVSFDDVAAQLVTLKEYSDGTYTVQKSEYAVLSFRRARSKGRIPFTVRPYYASIQSMNGMSERVSIPITQAQYETYYGPQTQKICIQLMTHISQNGAVRVLESDTESFKKTLRMPCD